jgi:hypothetical protein
MTVTPYEAAQRLGVHETQVTTVQERAEDHVVTLRDGSRMLISATVARPYVADIDDVTDSEDEVERDEVKPEVPKKAVAKKATGAKAA